jgi:hypothetical protein
MFDTNTWRLKVVVASLLGAAVCAVLVWKIRFAPARPRGSISVSFVGFTNSASGAVSALFGFSNGFPREIVVAAGAVQVRQSKGWPTVSVYGHPAGPVFMVAPSGAQIFVIHLPKVDGVVWRVPLHYEEVDTKLDQWTQRTKGALGLARPVKTWMVTNTPDMLGVSVHTMEPTGASRLGQETNKAP